MKLHVLSDLHTEFGPVEIPPTVADVIVLAGDIGLGLDGMRWALDRWKDRPVLYLAGNHEYYHHEFPELTAALATFAAGSRIRFMENTAEIIDGVRFLGCTLWTDFLFFGQSNRDLAMRAAALSMSDYRVVHKSPEGRMLTPRDTVAVHEISRRWLEAQLATPFAGPTVVLTHHAPSRKSIEARYLEDPVTAGFVSDLEAMMDGSRVSLWVHGHTHHNVDYQINGTRVFTNQFGYPQSKAPGFDPRKIVEIPVP